MNKQAMSVTQLIQLAKEKNPDLLKPPYTELIRGVRYYRPEVLESTITRIARNKRYGFTREQERIQNSIMVFN